ncbi:MAG: tRNA 2-thiouridine(34) synthase MnmA [Candidatus Kerfeldbacteria bacterium RIFOXYA2_FULL_38_24]|uniref:tRNA-specific 2-thiouridylase MnmA n=1 Tax=Candidatus Kerfeldbacteria bacterium RIFOXYB2_FULL_38_14 TaxID=1798547 RepID=A0A1G2BBW3_9BACT|nr:MAG: tRNA 2-thiouridine(34) synthase MnmA [Candidatus Kerfeldbacteria bacterium RIFOXYA2_FULL_38_24]OGY86059.1 MAG: tRNA 2-thiouridine(34) synthase MnmA [Candidatus Kerfeldbacteria bacterium RIFOXYB2_FULL_38_14]OGY88891.1 MAG: tRNA 2-thiouridine(34) synthase MnmA [Candidatus Kerfeldbacteria bacterium RIFOXYC2_FULL_38_9]
MKVVVGMSGGVDSSVAAYLLKQQGHQVVGVFMKNWDDLQSHPQYRKINDLGCVWKQDHEDADQVCRLLGIPFLTYNFIKEYQVKVFDLFLKELKKGRTPNPDIVCNQEIKFELFLKKALQEKGITAIATGHYASLKNNRLGRPKDRNKDQTYFLYRIKPEYLSKIIFPLANYLKSEVRKIAQDQHFPNAQKKDSTGICFIGDIDYRKFIQQHLISQKGEIVTATGKTLGYHEGLPFYTIGQRKGINIGGTGPYYVISKNLKENKLVVTNNKNDPRLFQAQCLVEDLHWLVKPQLPLQCAVQIRYRQTPQTAIIEIVAHNKVKVNFTIPQRAVTSGQSAVFYQKDCVLGGGVIQ